jgi:hypothetical protein
MSDADREWSLLDYDETSVKIWGPTATDRQPRTREWREACETLEAGGRFGRLSRQRAGV